jgi:hypothetical protein
VESDLQFDWLVTFSGAKLHAGTVQLPAMPQRIAGAGQHAAAQPGSIDFLLALNERVPDALHVFGGQLKAIRSFYYPQVAS